MKRISSRSRAALAGLACLLAVGADASTAWADEPAITDVVAARKLFAEAEKDEEAGRWLEVIGKLRRIVVFKETAGVRFHLALAEERVGQLVAARADYQRAFDLSRTMRDADGRDVNERSGKSLVDLLKRTPVVTVVASADAPTAVVMVDGAIDRAATERPFPHDPGEILIEASAPGRAPFRQVEKLAEGARVTIPLRLPAAVVEPPPGGPVAASAATDKPIRDGSGAQPPSRVPGYVFGGVAVAGLATGAVFYGLHLRLDEANDKLCGRPDVICDPRREQVASRERTVALVAGGVGLASAVASVYFFTRGPSTVAVGPSQLTYAHRF